MWQRAQSLYLIGVSIVSLVNLFMSLAVITAGTFWWKVSPLGVEPEGLAETWDQYIAAGLLGFLMFMAILVVTLFEKRKVQMRLIRLLQVVVILILAAQYWTVYQTNQTLKLMQHDTVVSYGLGLVLPIISFLLLSMAYNGVKKDEELVKSVDRIR